MFNIFRKLNRDVDVHYVDYDQNNQLHRLLRTYFIYETSLGRILLKRRVDELVDAGIDINLVNKDKDTPLSLAASKGLYEVVMCLLERGADMHYVDGRQNNLIHILSDSFNECYNKTRRDWLGQCIVKLVEAGVDAKQVNDDKETPIVIAARKGLCEVMTYLLKHGVDINYVDGRHNNLIHILLDSYDSYANRGLHALLQCVDKLVGGGVDVNRLNESKDTPLSIAASKGWYELVIYMLEHGGDKHYVDGDKNNLMHKLLYMYSREDNTGEYELLQRVVKLVDAGVDVNQVNDEKETPLLTAARYGLSNVVIYLLKHGVDIDSLNGNILHYVLWYMYRFVQFEEKYIHFVNTLINTESGINQPDYKGNTPLFLVGTNKPHSNHMSGYSECLDTAKGIPMKLDRGKNIQCLLQCKLINILLKAGCNVNHQNTRGQTALMHHIIQQADISILKLLIPHSDLSLTDNNGNTAISYCVQYHMFNSTTVFKLLVDSGSDLMSLNNGVKLFHDILKSKRLWVFNYCLSLNLIVNGVTAEGENMHHLLAGVNYEYSLKKFYWLLSNDLDINHPCSKTNTPTMIAAFLLNSKYLELLTRHSRLDINTQNNQGHTALHLCIIGFTMFKDGLNKRQVNDVVKNCCKQIYPIYMACIDTLLGVRGIDVNIQDGGGRTSLMMAAMKNDRVLTRKLLQTGAIVTVLDYSGRSALQYLNIYQSVFDLTCFKLLLSNGYTGLLNLPCIDGNKIIQTVLCFPRLWEPCRAVRFIRYLVAKNCCLNILVTSPVESNYNQIVLDELSLQERDTLRKLLYLSGAQGEQIMTSLNFDQEDKQYEDNDKIRSRDREEFISFCSNVSLKSICRRFIRQNLGLGIKEKMKDLELPRELNDFLLLKDVLHPHDYNLDHMDYDCNYFDDDDDYDGYDIDKDRNDDYSQYNYQYVTLNTDHELRQHFIETSIFPNGEVDDDKDGDYSLDHIDECLKVIIC